MLKLLTERLFDHAGMYPPESASFEETLKRAANFKIDLKNPSLVNTHIVIPAKDLEKLNEKTLSAVNFDKNEVFFISTLGSSEEDFRNVIEFNENNRSKTFKQNVLSFEIKIDEDFKEKNFLLPYLLTNNTTFSPLIFLEPNLSCTSWEEKLKNCLSIIRDTNKKLAKQIFGLKVRGTGKTAIQNDKLAKVIELVSDAEILLKATAGLHHPIIETERYNNNLGFLNLSLALYLRRTLGRKFSANNILELLKNEKTDSITFLESEIKWTNFTLKKINLKELKNKFPFSIGSCSLKEPDLDLIRLFPDN